MIVSAVADYEVLLPGGLQLEDLWLGRSAITLLGGDFPVPTAAQVTQPLEPPADWPFPQMPRALSFALEAVKPFKHRIEAECGLVLGLPSLFVETPYVEHTLRHRYDQNEMRAMMGFSRDVPLNFLADHLGLTGPRIRVDSACATGNDALITAHQWVSSGMVREVLVVAASAAVNPLGLALFNNLKALNDQVDVKASRPFDLKRRGFVMGEGAAAVLLTQPDTRNAKGYICGYGQTSNGDKFVELPENPEAMVEAGKQALDGLESVAYISAHGTGTVTNDIKETQVYHQLFGRQVYNIPISSIKSMIGHCLTAAGLIEAVVCLETLTRQEAPPTINLEHPDPQCDLNYVPNKRAPISGDFCLSNTFAFGGHNSGVLISRERP